MASIYDATNVPKITYSGKTTNIKGNGANVPDSEKHLEPTTPTDYPYDEGSYAETQISPNLDREFSPTLAARYDKKDHVVYADGLRVTTVDIPLKYDDRYVRNNSGLLSKPINNNSSYPIIYGGLWGAGWNANGVLGNPTVGQQSSFMRIGRSEQYSFGRKIIKEGDYYIPIASRSGWSLVILRGDGTIWAVGSNSIGQLGVGDTLDKDELTQVGTETNWRELYTCGAWSMAINNKNELWGWGQNDGGQLGLGNTAHQSSPQLIETNTDFVKLFVGGERKFAGIKSDGSVWTAGFNSQYELGNGLNAGTITTFTKISPPVPVRAYIFVASAAIIWGTDGSLWSIGSNVHGTLGTNGSTAYTATSWEKINWKWDDIISIDASHYNINVVTASGKRIGWGLSSQGQMGDGTTTMKTFPTYVDDGWDHLVACGSSHEHFGVKRDGSLWAWGYNLQGEAGVGSTTQLNSPTQITFPSSDLSVVDIQAVDRATYMITSPKKIQQLITWGGLSGNGDGTNYFSTYYGSVKVLNDVAQVVAQDNFTLILKTDGTLWSTGTNSQGQLGVGDNIDKYVFTQIGVDNSWEYIYDGYSSSGWARKTDGSIWCWGANFRGNLGLGDNAPRNTPTLFGNVSTWKNLYLGQFHVIVEKIDGTLWGFGTGYGLNQNSSGDFTSPVLVYNNTDWRTVSCGRQFTLLEKSDGTVWATGNNNYKQLGTGDGLPKLNFVKIMDNAYINDITTGFFTCLIKGDNTLWVWGYNNNQQLGLGPVGNIDIPTQIGSDKDWERCFGKFQFTIVKKMNGQHYFAGAPLKSGDKTVALGAIPSQYIPIDIPKTYSLSCGQIGFALTD